MTEDRIVSAEDLVVDLSRCQAEAVARIRARYDDPEAAQAAVEAFLTDQARNMAELFDVAESPDSSPPGYVSEQAIVASYGLLGFAEAKAELQARRAATERPEPVLRPPPVPRLRARSFGAPRRPHGRRPRRRSTASRASPAGQSEPPLDPPDGAEPCSRLEGILRAVQAIAASLRDLCVRARRSPRGGRR